MQFHFIESSKHCSSCWQTKQLFLVSIIKLKNLVNSPFQTRRGQVLKLMKGYQETWLNFPSWVTRRGLKYSSLLHLNASLVLLYKDDNLERIETSSWRSFRRVAYCVRHGYRIKTVAIIYLVIHPLASGIHARRKRPYETVPLGVLLCAHLLLDFCSHQWLPSYSLHMIRRFRQAGSFLLNVGIFENWWGLGDDRM